MTVHRPSYGVAAVLLVVVAAGCLGAPAEDQQGHLTYEPAAPSGATASAAVRDCSYNSVQAPIPWDPVAEALPAGFSPAPFTMEEVHRGRHAGLIVDVYECRGGHADDRPVEAPSGTMAKIRVEPPQRFRHSALGEGAYWIPVAVQADERGQVEAFRDWGFPVAEAAPTVDRRGDPALARVVEADARGPGVDLRVRTTLAGPSDLVVGGERSRYFGLSDPLFSTDDPDVVAVIDRSTTATEAMAGEGDLTLSGSRIPDELQGPLRGGLGFDTPPHDYGWTFRLQDRAG